MDEVTSGNAVSRQPRHISLLNSIGSLNRSINTLERLADEIINGPQPTESKKDTEGDENGISLAVALETAPKMIAQAAARIGELRGSIREAVL